MNERRLVGMDEKRSLRRVSGILPGLLLALLLSSLCGCASISNPVAQGLPIERLADELRAIPRDEQQIIPLNLLGQSPPEVYRVGPGDTLGIWIDGILGEKGLAPPAAGEGKDLPGKLSQGVGYPVPVQENGTITLPQLLPIQVHGLSLAEVQDALRTAYTVDKEILRPGRERIIVTLIRPRSHRVVVMREDSSQINLGQGLIGAASRGTGHQLNLPAYENDVLHALALTGGLPGRDAYREVVIHRSQTPGPHLHGVVPRIGRHELAGPRMPVVRIPLTTFSDQLPDIRPEDVILQTGDVVYLESREREVYYTGGLLPPAQRLLPRDFDLDVVEAVVNSNGPLINGGISGSNLSGAINVPGLGTPSPSLLSVIRKTPGGKQVVIRVDLNRALQDPRERIIVMPGDVLILQETPGEAFARFISQSFNLTFGFRGRNVSGTGVLGNPPAPSIFPE